MENQEIVYKIKLLGNLLELHDENPFKVRALQNAYSTVKKVSDPIENMSVEELSALPGVGKNIAASIIEIAADGTTQELTQLQDKTPEGVVEMFNIKGIGPKKIGVFWRTMGLMSVGELIYYCSENRLKDAKGFGEKSQKDILEKAQLYLNGKNKWLYAKLEPVLIDFESVLENSELINYQLTGQAFRKSQIVDKIVYIVEADTWPPYIENFEIEDENDDAVTGVYNGLLKVELILCEEDVVKEAFLQSFEEDVPLDLILNPREIQNGKKSETEIFKDLSINFISPELRWNAALCKIEAEDLVKDEDIKGVIHCHTTYSDGIHSVKEMCSYARENGYSYIAITDHSQSAFYAKGLIIEQVYQQHREIEKLKLEFPDLTIFKSIESDILNDGSLDYEEEVLASFDFIIGSIHSVLNMDESRATTRLIKAIENPYMNMLGHMSGRLLLARKGYPLDYSKILDACVANNVIIELNANPQRLDIDYKLIKMATDRGVLISINPDAHSKQAINDIRYGVIAGRSGGLLKDHVINSLDAAGFIKTLKG